jgi:hypothetical protein
LYTASLTSWGCLNSKKFFTFRIGEYFKEPCLKDKNYSGSTTKIVDLDNIREFEETPRNDYSTTQNKLERSNKWYFEIGYQHAFSISLFSLSFAFGVIIPFVLPITALFFTFKYLIDKYNMVVTYRVEYEANAYIRKRVCNFSIMSIGVFQFVMVVWFLGTGDEDMIILSFLLLIFSIVILYYFISIDAWTGKKKKNPQLFVPDTFDDEDEDEKTDSPLASPMSVEIKLKKKSSSKSGSLYRPENLKVEGMTPPSASPFQIPNFHNARIDAYLHPWAKKFSTEEVLFNKESSFRSIARFSTTEQFQLNSTPSNSDLSLNKKDSDEKPVKYRGIGDFLAQSLYDQ